MQPARQDLAVVPGDTYRDTVRLMQPVYEYRNITAITGAPAQLSVPAHGLAVDWPVWVRGVSGLPELNREPPRTQPWLAARLDANTLSINAVSAEDARPQGGQLMYRPPVDLTGSTVRMAFADAAGEELFVLLHGAGLEVSPAGLVTRELTPVQTAQLVGEWTYRFTVTYADGAMTTYLVGGQKLPGGACGC
jgi:hypothetical protein